MNNLLKELKDFYQEVIDSLDYICFNYPDFPLDIEVAMWIGVGTLFFVAICFIASL